MIIRDDLILAALRFLVNGNDNGCISCIGHLNRARSS